MYDVNEHGKALGYINDKEGYEKTIKTLGSMSKMSFNIGWRDGRLQFIKDRIETAIQLMDDGKNDVAKDLLKNTQY